MREYEDYNSATVITQKPVPMSVEQSERFLVRVYANLLGAVLATAALVFACFSVYSPETIAQVVAANSKLVSLCMLALCVGAPAIANSIIAQANTRAVHYCILGFYTLMYAAFVVPLLAFTLVVFKDPAIIWQACGLTAAIFVALSAAVFMTRHDFTFMRSFLVFAGWTSILLVGASIFFHIELGAWFSVAMIVMMCGYILYETSDMVEHASPEDDVLYSIELFASVMTLFFYILRLIGELRR